MRKKEIKDTILWRVRNAFFGAVQQMQKKNFFKTGKTAKVFKLHCNNLDKIGRGG